MVGVHKSPNEIIIQSLSSKVAKSKAIKHIKQTSKTINRVICALYVIASWVGIVGISGAERGQSSIGSLFLETTTPPIIQPAIPCVRPASKAALGFRQMRKRDCIASKTEKKVNDAEGARSGEKRGGD